MQEKDQKRILKLADFADDKDLATAESFIKIDEDIEEIEEKIELTKSELSSLFNDKIEEVKQSIASIEIPASVDHSEHMKMMMDKIEEPQEITVTLNII